MKRKIKLASVILLMLSLLIVPLCTHADFGDFAGDSDYGWDDDDDDDYDYSWDDDDDDDYSYSYDNDRDYSYSRDYDNDSDYSYHGNNSGNSYSGNYSSGRSYTYTSRRSALFSIFYVFRSLIFITIIAIFVHINRVKRSKTITPQQRQQQHQSDLFPIENFYNIDPTFSPEEMKRRIADMYADFQKCWQEKDISPLRRYMTSAFYAQMDRQLDNYRNNHRTNYIDDIKVLGIELIGWRKEGSNIAMIARIHTSIIDYVTDDNTGDIIRGSMKDQKRMCYEWTVVRPECPPSNRSSVQTCPNCGAHIDVNYSGVCEYCGTTISTPGADWAVSNIKGLSQQTQRGR